MLPVPKSRGVQCLIESSVTRLMYAIFIYERDVVQRHGTPDETGAVF